MRILHHIRDQWMGAAALFLVLASGTAYAANTVFSSDIVDGQVKTPDLANGAVATDKLSDGAVTTGKVKNDNLTGGDVLPNSLKGSDIDESTLTNIGGGGPAGGDLAGTYPNPQIAANAVGATEVANDSLTGFDVNESTLGQVPSALTASLGGIGRSTGGGQCDPENETFQTCASVPLNLPAGARVLVTGVVGARPETDANNGFGTCRIGTNVTGGLAGSETFVSESDAFGHAFPVVFVTPPLGAGPVSLGIDCNQDEDAGAIVYTYSRISAVAISAG